MYNLSRYFHASTWKAKLASTALVVNLSIGGLMGGQASIAAPSISNFFNKVSSFLRLPETASAVSRALQADKGGAVNQNKNRSLTEGERKLLYSRFGDQVDLDKIRIEVDDNLKKPREDGLTVLGQTREGSPGVIFINPSVYLDDYSNADLYKKGIMMHEGFHYWQENDPYHWIKVIADKYADEQEKRAPYEFVLNENTKFSGSEGLSKERQASAMENFEVRQNSLGDPYICAEAFRLKNLLKQEIPMNVPLPCEGFAPLSAKDLEKADRIMKEFLDFENKGNFLQYIMLRKPTAARAIFIHAVLTEKNPGYPVSWDNMQRMKQYVKRDDVKPFIYQKLTNEDKFHFFFKNPDGSAIPSPAA